MLTAVRAPKVAPTQISIKRRRRLQRIRLCPNKIGSIVAAAIVLSALEH